MAPSLKLEIAPAVPQTFQSGHTTLKNMPLAYHQALNSKLFYNFAFSKLTPQTMIILTSVIVAAMVTFSNMN